MKSVRIAAGAVFASLSGALLCGAVAASAPEPEHDAALPAPAQLAALAFPGWRDNAAGRVHTVQVPPGGGGRQTGWNSGTMRVVVEPRLVLRSDPGRVTLIAGLVPAGDNGRPAVAHTTPMALAAYQFERSKGTWSVSERQGIFAWRGFSGAAALRAVTLSDRHQGLGVEYGSCWQGYCGTWLALYEVHRGMVRREPAVEMALSGTNVDGVGDCSRRLQPLVKRAPDPAARRDGAVEEHDCYAIEGAWSIAAEGELPGDLNVHYQGAMSRAGARLSPPVAIDQRQVLRYGSGKYRAVSGFNPVPAI